MTRLFLLASLHFLCALVAPVGAIASDQLWWVIAGSSPMRFRATHRRAEKEAKLGGTDGSPAAHIFRRRNQGEDKGCDHNWQADIK
jgi:hypothetical protein